MFNDPLYYTFSPFHVYYLITIIHFEISIKLSSKLIKNENEVFLLSFFFSFFFVKWQASGTNFENSVI
jgi:hypothetical protein